MPTSSCFQAHDLLWGMSAEMLNENAPTWVKDVLAQGHPVVVRRALAPDHLIAVGIRGGEKHQRFASFMPVSAVKKQRKPEQLIACNLPRLLLLNEKLASIRSVLTHFGLTWGFTGSVGFELATGVAVVTAQSDIDVLMRTPQYLNTSVAQMLLKHLQQHELKIDVQLQTLQGGVALKDWANSTGKVLLKRNDGAVLVKNPWDEKDN